MPLAQYTLIEKKRLTHDIYELQYKVDQDFSFIAGQFITFILPNIGGRAYSILEKKNNSITLIIKKREVQNNGRGGSKYICEQSIGSILNGTIAAGHFILQQNNNNKLFIGTGTGFVPLYNQIVEAIKNNQEAKLHLLFGVRKQNDLFYIQQLKQLKQNHRNFDYTIYLSREENSQYKVGYVTDFLTIHNINMYQEFYICGAGNMIDSTLKILQTHKINQQSIYFEKY